MHHNFAAIIKQNLQLNDFFFTSEEPLYLELEVVL